GVLFDVEINTMFLVALLTVIGYSVNDTIVVFDRLRENILLYPNRTFAANANISILESLGRSLNTSLTLLFTLLALLLFGGPTIRVFLWVLLISWLNVPLAVIRMYSAQKALALSFVIAPCLQLVAAIALWWAGETDPEIYYPWWAATYGLETVTLFVLGYRILARAGVQRWMTAPVQIRGQGLATAWWTNLSQSLNVVVQQVDVILVSAIISMEAVTIYRFLKQVGTMITRLVDPLFQSSFADLMRIGTAPGVDSLQEFLRATTVFGFISVPLCILAAITSPLWLSIIFGPEQAFLWSTVAIFMIAISVVSTFVAIHPLAIGLGFARATTLIQVCSYTLFLTGVVYLGGFYGLVGVACSYLIAMLLMVGWKLYLVLPRLRVGR
ncbi:MAG: hypothetical protein IH908_02055, partial [Proteobacteria bacterium]|nr:hypothetical protein [Pseudomonadota bacterium]